MAFPLLGFLGRLVVGRLGNLNVGLVDRAAGEVLPAIDSFMDSGSGGSGGLGNTVHVKGLKELNDFLNTFPQQMQKRAMRGGLRAGMKVVQPIAQHNVHSVSGLLAAGLKISTRSRGGTVTASLRTTGEHAHVAKWIEYGTSAHNIAAKKSAWLSFGGIFRKAITHPGIKPRPFLRPALDSQAQPAVAACAAYIKNKLDHEDWRRGGTYSIDHDLEG